MPLRIGCRGVNATLTFFAHTGIVLKPSADAVPQKKNGIRSGHRTAGREFPDRATQVRHLLGVSVCFETVYPIFG